ncbi:hypothetical protein Tco_0080103 [Tanacetum coccineum]
MATEPNDVRLIPEMMRVGLLSDHPFINYGLHPLQKTTGTDMRNTNTWWNSPPPSSTSSSNFEFQQMAAALEDKMTLTFRNEMNEDEA